MYLTHNNQIFRKHKNGLCLQVVFV